MARGKLSNKAFATLKPMKTLWSGVTETVRLTYTHITTMVFLVTWVLIYILMLSFPPKILLTDKDLMDPDGTSRISDSSATDDRTKFQDDLRYSDRGKQVILGWSVLFAFIVALFIHFFQMYV